MTKNDKGGAVDVMARALVRRSRSAALATALTGRRQGWPYASLVSVACSGDASPLLLLSTLADHTRNLIEDPRASLLFEEAAGLPNPQTGPRVTLTGRLKPTGQAGHARRFLARHPGAALYAGFADFSFYRMSVERAHFVGGFGSATWFGAKKFLYDAQASRAVAESEQRLIGRLNKDYWQVLSRLAGKQGKAGKEHWKIGGIDPEGLDLVKGDSFSRQPFANPVRTGRGIRGEIEKLLKKMDIL